MTYLPDLAFRVVRFEASARSFQRTFAQALRICSSIFPAQQWYHYWHYTLERGGVRRPRHSPRAENDAAGRGAGSLRASSTLPMRLPTVGHHRGLASVVGTPPGLLTMASMIQKRIGQ